MGPCKPHLLHLQLVWSCPLERFGTPLYYIKKCGKNSKSCFPQMLSWCLPYQKSSILVLRLPFSEPAEIHFPKKSQIQNVYSPRSYYVRASTSPKNFGPKWPRARVMPKNPKTASQGTKNEHFLKSHNLLLDSHSLTKFGGMID